MSRIKLILLSLLAVFAFSAVAAASASAHEFIVPCHKVSEPNKGTGEYKNSACTEPEGSKEYTKKLLSGEELKVKGTSGPGKLSVPSLKITIACKKDKFTGTIKANGRTTATVKFEECIVEGFPACEVGPIEFSVNDVLVIFKEALGDAFEPEAGLNFVTIKLSGSSCTVKGKYEVKGKQQCELPEAEVEKATHEIRCTPAGSELKFGEDEATFEDNETVELESGEPWSAKL